MKGANTKYIEWGQWKKEVFLLMKTKYSGIYGKDSLSRDIDWKAWKEIWKEDYRPEDAILEDLSYAVCQGRKTKMTNFPQGFWGL